MAFYSFPGGRNYGGEGRANAGRSLHNVDPRKVEALKEDPRYADWFRNRPATSHTSTGFNEGERVNYRDTDRGAVVLREEVNQHTGFVEQELAVNDPDGSGHRRLTWEPNGDRGLIQVDDRRAD